MEDYEQVYEDFWKDVLENLDGTLNVDAVKKELFDWYFAMGEVAEVYCHITNGVLSKPNYYASSVIAVADEYVDRLIAEALEDAEDAQGAGHQWLKFFLTLSPEPDTLRSWERK